MPSATLYWNRCQGDAWGELFSVDLDDPHFEGLEGVYMVWMGGPQPAAICVGSGPLREKLKERRADPAVAVFKGKSLLVSWAKLDAVTRPGVERWLLESLRPKITQPIPSSPPVTANLPGAATGAKPDAGPPPRQIFENLLQEEGHVTARVEKPAPEPEPAPVATPAPKQAEAPLLKLPLQAPFLELVKRARGTPKAGGFFGGGGRASPEDEKLVTDTVQMVLREAARVKASDIHLEPLEGYLRVRLRMDGILEEVLQIPASLNLRVVSQIRVSSGLDPERGIGTSKPEDARMSFSHEGNEWDVRLSTFPTTYGDKAVLRLIPRGARVPPLEDIGLAPKTIEALRSVATRPQGMFIVTGPTGSGKSTTLYTILASLNDPSRNIVTLEDPIEKKIPGINQGMIQPKAGFGFAEGLRAILRQDPNVIMVGEIRDLETAEIAVSASLTGHMLFTTLHTNSALGAITRMMDMNLEPFLIASAVTAVSAQRLARRVCANCAQPYDPTPAEVAEIEDRARRAGVRVPEGLTRGLKRGSGCEACRRTGYQGRVLLFEFVAITPTLRQQILKKAHIDELRAAAIKDGLEPMLLDGLRKAAEGLTTTDEVFRVVDAAD